MKGKVTFCVYFSVDTNFSFQETLDKASRSQGILPTEVESKQGVF